MSESSSSSSSSKDEITSSSSSSSSSSSEPPVPAPAPPTLAYPIHYPLDDGVDIDILKSLPESLSIHLHHTKQTEHEIEKLSYVHSAFREQDKPIRDKKRKVIMDAWNLEKPFRVWKSIANAVQPLETTSNNQHHYIMGLYYTPSPSSNESSSSSSDESESSSSSSSSSHKSSKIVRLQWGIYPHKIREIEAHKLHMQCMERRIHFEKNRCIQGRKIPGRTDKNYPALDDMVYYSHINEHAGYIRHIVSSSSNLQAQFDFTFDTTKQHLHIQCKTPMIGGTTEVFIKQSQFREQYAFSIPSSAVITDTAKQYSDELEEWETIVMYSLHYMKAKIPSLLHPLYVLDDELSTKDDIIDPLDVILYLNVNERDAFFNDFNHYTNQRNDMPSLGTHTEYYWKRFGYYISQALYRRSYQLYTLCNPMVHPLYQDKTSAYLAVQRSLNLQPYADGEEGGFMVWPSSTTNMKPPQERMMTYDPKHILDHYRDLMYESMNHHYLHLGVYTTKPILRKRLFRCGTSPYVQIQPNEKNTIPKKLQQYQVYRSVGCHLPDFLPSIPFSIQDKVNHLFHINTGVTFTADFQNYVYATNHYDLEYHIKSFTSSQQQEEASSRPAYYIHDTEFDETMAHEGVFRLLPPYRMSNHPIVTGREIHHTISSQHITKEEQFMFMLQTVFYAFVDRVVPQEEIHKTIKDEVVDVIDAEIGVGRATISKIMTPLEIGFVDMFRFLPAEPLQNMLMDIILYETRHSVPLPQFIQTWNIKEYTTHLESRQEAIIALYRLASEAKLKYMALYLSTDNGVYTHLYDELFMENRSNPSIDVDNTNMKLMSRLTHKMHINNDNIVNTNVVDERYHDETVVPTHYLWLTVMMHPFYDPYHYEATDLLTEAELEDQYRFLLHIKPLIIESYQYHLPSNEIESLWFISLFQTFGKRSYMDASILTIFDMRPLNHLEKGNKWIRPKQFMLYVKAHQKRNHTKHAAQTLKKHPHAVLNQWTLEVLGLKGDKKEAELVTAFGMIDHPDIENKRLSRKHQKFKISEISREVITEIMVRYYMASRFKWMYHSGNMSVFTLHPLPSHDHTIFVSAFQMHLPTTNTLSPEVSLQPSKITAWESLTQSDRIESVERKESFQCNIYTVRCDLRATMRKVKSKKFKHTSAERDKLYISTLQQNMANGHTIFQSTHYEVTNNTNTTE